jgi:hypothetical protein
VAYARILLATLLTTLLATGAGTASAFSQGAPVCEVNSLPLVEMSPTLASPAPSGWALAASTATYVPGRALRVHILQPDSAKRARGVLLFAKSGPSSGVGNFALPSGLYQYIPAPAECGEWALSHTSATPKSVDELQWDYSIPAAAGTVILRAFLIEDCGLAGGACRDQQALTPVLVLYEAIQVDGFE